MAKIRCKTCIWSKKLGNKLYECHGKPPVPLGTLNVPQGKAKTKQITNGIVRPSRAIWSITKSTDWCKEAE